MLLGCYVIVIMNVLKKKELSKSFNILIDYLELRDKSNLKINYKVKNSKLFAAFYLNNVRLIDNF